MRLFTLLAALVVLGTTAFAQVPVSGGVFSKTYYGPTVTTNVAQSVTSGNGVVSPIVSLVVPAGQTYYLNYAQLDGIIVGVSQTAATLLGNVSLQIGGVGNLGQVLMTNVAVAYQAQWEPGQFMFPTPYVVQGGAGGVTVSLNVIPTGGASVLWSGNLGGHS